MEALPSLPVELLVPTTYGEGTSAAQGVYAGRGVLRADADVLVLDVRPIGSVGAADVESYRIPLAAVSQVEFVSSWVRTRLVLRPRHLAAFADLTGVQGDALTLKVARRERALASRWATELSLALLAREDG